MTTLSHETDHRTRSAARSCRERYESCEATIRILQQQSDREDEKVRRLEQHLEWAQHQSMADGIARDKAEASVRRLEQERDDWGKMMQAAIDKADAERGQAEQRLALLTERHEEGLRQLAAQTNLSRSAETARAKAVQARVRAEERLAEALQAYDRETLDS